MRKITLLIVIFLYSSRILAQKDTADFKQGWGALDYAVPESPAFQLLGASPGNILQPVSVKSIAVSVGSYYLTSGNTIPKNLAVEISPLLFSPKASLNDYNKNRFWYRTRLSLGTSVMGNGSYGVAEGLRFTIIDETDLRTNKKALDYFYSQAKDNTIALTSALKDYATKNQECKNPIDCSELFRTDSNFKKKILKMYADKLLNTDSIEDFRDKMRHTLWNHKIMEAGIAALQTSPDSLIKNLAVAKYGLWFTYGTHITKNDQLLIGLNGGITDSASKSVSNYSLGIRYYYGGNDLRAFLQLQYANQNNIATETLSLGTVCKITNGLWGQFILSLIIDKNGNITYSPGFNIGLGTPEKKKY